MERVRPDAPRIGADLGIRDHLECLVLGRDERGGEDEVNGTDAGICARRGRLPFSPRPAQSGPSLSEKGSPEFWTTCTSGKISPARQPPPESPSVESREVDRIMNPSGEAVPRIWSSRVRSSASLPNWTIEATPTDWARPSRAPLRRARSTSRRWSERLRSICVRWGVAVIVRAIVSLRMRTKQLPFTRLTLVALVSVLSATARPSAAQAPGLDLGGLIEVGGDGERVHTRAGSGWPRAG